jgi:hypothetical protein
MSIETAKKVKQFFENNEILGISLMGGEFFCNPQWKEIFEILFPGLAYVRLVTNGDWAHDESVPKFLKQLEKVMFEESSLKISISKDRWHSNKNVDKAIAACKKYGINYNVAAESETTEESIVPVGRGDLNFGLYAMFACYCHNPQHMYSFLIDEQGKIYKCGFGVWDYAKIDDYLKGNFDKRFKEYNQKFYSCFISNCRSCLRAYQSA